MNFTKISWNPVNSLKNLKIQYSDRGLITGEGFWKCYIGIHTPHHIPSQMGEGRRHFIYIASCWRGVWNRFQKVSTICLNHIEIPAVLLGFLDTYISLHLMLKNGSNFLVSYLEDLGYNLHSFCSSWIWIFLHVQSMTSCEVTSTRRMHLPTLTARTR